MPERRENSFGIVINSFLSLHLHNKDQFAEKFCSSGIMRKVSKVGFSLQPSKFFIIFEGNKDFAC